MKLATSLAALTFLLPSIAYADSSPIPAKPTTTPAPAPVTKPASTERLSSFESGVEYQPKPSDYKVSLSLEDAELSELLRVMGELTGRRFIVGSAKIASMKASIFAPQKVTVAEAYQAFLATLHAHGLTVLPDGAFWKVVETQDVTKQGTPVEGLHDGASGTGEERYVTRLVRLHHVGVEDVATNVLAKFSTHDGTIVTYAPGNLLIVTDTGENIRRLLRIAEEIDVATTGDQVWLEPLYYVSAADAEKELHAIFGMESNASTGAGKAGDAKPAALATDDRLTRVVPIDRPNGIVIVGTKSAYERVLEVLKRIDVPAPSDGEIHVIALAHADAKKIVPAINEAVQGALSASNAQAKPGQTQLGILEAPVKISAEETTNSILVTASSHDFAAVRDVIAKLDQPRRQVYIEAVVMDVSLERSTTVGVKFHGADAVNTLGSGQSLVYGGMNPIASASSPDVINDKDLQALALGIRGPTIDAVGMSIPAFGAVVEAHAESSDSDILQTPHVLATDNIPAEIHVQLNRSLQQNSQSYGSLASLAGQSGNTGAASALASASPFVGSAPALQNYKAIGPKIKVTAHLNDSDDVRLDIEEVISDVAGDPEGTLGTIPFLERGATTTLTVHDRQTAVIGGLVRDKVAHSMSKVPLLGDIPVLGFLFRHKEDSIEKSNLVLVLTPTIVRDQDDLRQIVERKMEERQDLIDHEALFDDRARDALRPFGRPRSFLFEVRESARHIEEERAAAASAGIKEPPRTHAPSEPIGAVPVPINVSADPHAAREPAAKALERVER